MFGSNAFVLSLVAILSMAWSTAAVAQEASNMPAAPADESYALPNGLQVTLAPRSGSGRAAIVVRYGVGTRDDPAGYRGLATLTQQLVVHAQMPVGTDALYPFFREGFASAAGAQVTRDYSFFHADMSASELELGLWFEATRMAALLEHADEPTLERARAAVLRGVEGSEVQGMSRPYLRIISRSLYPAGHPYHSACDGPRDAAEIELAHVRWFFQRYYGPRNAHLYVVGDFAPVEAKKHVERAFAFIRNSPLEPARAPLPPARPEGEHLVRIVENHAARTCMLAWSSAAQGSEDDRALRSLARVLSDRLRRSSSGAPDLERRNGARQLSGQGESLFVVSVDVAVDEHPKYLLGEIDTLLEQARRGGAPALPAWSAFDAAAGGVLEQAQRLAGLVPERDVSPPDAMAKAARTWLGSRRVMICSDPGPADAQGQITMHKVRDTGGDR